MPLGATVPPQAALRSDPGVGKFTAEGERRGRMKGRERKNVERIIYTVIVIDAPPLMHRDDGKSDALFYVGWLGG